MIDEVEKIINHVFENPEGFSSYYLIKNNISSNTIHKIRAGETSIDSLSWKTIKKIIKCYDEKANS